MWKQTTPFSEKNEVNNIFLEINDEKWGKQRFFMKKI